jgi:hypothetical protein
LFASGLSRFSPPLPAANPAQSAATALRGSPLIVVTWARGHWSPNIHSRKSRLDMAGAVACSFMQPQGVLVVAVVGVLWTHAQDTATAPLAPSTAMLCRRSPSLMFDHCRTGRVASAPSRLVGRVVRVVVAHPLGNRPPQKARAVPCSLTGRPFVFQVVRVLGAALGDIGATVSGLELHLVRFQFQLQSAEVSVGLLHLPVFFLRDRVFAVPRQP